MDCRATTRGLVSTIGSSSGESTLLVTRVVTVSVNVDLVTDSVKVPNAVGASGKSASRDDGSTTTPSTFAMILLLSFT